MLKLALSILICSFAFATHGQERLSMLFNLAQSSNNHTYEDLFDDRPLFKSPVIPTTNDQFGFSIRKSTENGRLYELMLASSLHLHTVEIHGPPIPFDADNKVYSGTNLDLHMRLEFGKSITFIGLPNLYFGISASLDPRFTLRYYQSMRGNIFTFRAMSFETSVLVNPQIEYSINDRINFLLKMPLRIFTLNSVFVDTRNPSLSREEQVFSKRFVDFLPISPTYSIGVGYYITHRDR